MCVTALDKRLWDTSQNETRQRGRRDNIHVNPQRIVVVGAGHVGLYAALRLSRKLSRRRAEVVVIDPQPHMTYQPFLPEAAAGNISPRHSVVPLRRELKKCRIVSGEVTKIEHARKTVTIQPIDGPSTARFVGSDAFKRAWSGELIRTGVMRSAVNRVVAP